MKTLLIGLLVLGSFSGMASLTKRDKKRIIESVKEVLQAEIGSDCMDETINIDGQDVVTATGGVSVGLFSVSSIYKSKCGDVLVKTKYKNKGNKLSKIVIEFDSNYKLLQERN